MNTLSWFIYFIGTVESINISMIFIFVSLLILSGIKILGLDEIYVNEKGEKWEYDRVKILKGHRIPFSLKQMLTTIIIIMSIDVVIPSKQTLILIAASEYGEKIANSDKVNQLVDPSLDLLKTWIEKEKRKTVE